MLRIMFGFLFLMSYPALADEHTVADDGEPQIAAIICVDPASGTETEIALSSLQSDFKRCPQGQDSFIRIDGIELAPGAEPVIREQYEQSQEGHAQ